MWRTMQTLASLIVTATFAGAELPLESVSCSAFQEGRARVAANERAAGRLIPEIVSPSAIVLGAVEGPSDYQRMPVD